VADVYRNWVIDTSSLLGVRELFGRAGEKKVFATLSGLVTRGCLFFPPEVYHELERGSPADTVTNDPALEWAKTVRTQAEKAASLETVKAVLAIAAELLDPDKSDEQADPYVLAVAIDVRGLGFDVTVVTDDFRDKPGKLSLATAAGMLGVPSVPLGGFARIITAQS
jgi:hypothetical protein